VTTYLNALIVSNVRRFCSETALPLTGGPGATILLAPNGHGKTTVFDAIELALTGAVRRLGPDLDPLIRDGQAQARVDLIFGERMLSASVGKGRAAVMEGNAGALLGRPGEKGIDDRLRLTHLMTQSGAGSWLVELEGEAEAGQMVAALPAVRDVAVAQVALEKARKAQTARVNTLEEVAQRAEQALERWNGRIRARDEALDALAGDTQPREPTELHAGLVALATAPWAAGAGIGTEQGAEPVVAGADMLGRRLVSYRESIEKRLNRLGAAAALIDVYAERSADAQEKRSRASGLRAKRSELVTAKEAAELRLAKAIEDASAAARSIAEMRSKRDQLGELASARQAVQEKERALDGALAATQEAEKAAGAALTALREAEASHRLVASLASKERSLAMARKAVDDAAKVLPAWRAREATRPDRVAVLAQAKLAVARADNDLDVLRGRAASLETVVAKTRAEYARLADSCDELRKAVSAVAELLPHDASTCPVCHTGFDSGVLRRRIDEALASMTPGLATAGASLAAAEEDLTVATDRVSDAKAVRDELAIKVQAAVSALARLDEESGRDRAVPPLNGCELDEAPARLAERHAIIDQQLAAVRKEKVGLPDEATLNAEMEALRTTSEARERALMSSRAQHRHLDAELNQLRARIAGLTESLGADTPTLAGLEQVLVAREQALNTAPGVTAIQTEVEVATRALAACDLHLTDLEEARADADDRLRATIDAWREPGLAGEPSSAALSTAEFECRRQAAETEAAEREILSIRDEATRWVHAERSKRAQIEVDELSRPGEDEERAASRLMADAERGRLRLADARRTSETLQKLADELKSRRNEFDKAVLAPATPLLHGMLRRLVRDRRWHDVEWDFSTRRNRPQAGMTTAVHGDRHPVRKIASEAQTTKIQLALLIALARTQRWSRWPALLLDDPTQHQDLAHAAAVFDVLRDQIVDHGFQVLFSTHDSVHAEFFERKLRNDGVPCNIVTLVPTRAGVRFEAAS
jgi:exonuclease SbcC